MAAALRPIGWLETPFKAIADCPRNGRQPDPPPPCTAVVLPEFVSGLQNLEGFSHLILLYWLDQVTAPALTFTPPFDGEARGVFATRAPHRPNPIGLSVVAFDGFDGPDRLQVRYLDCIDRTPLLDIKPYLPSTDAEPAARTGWLTPHVGRGERAGLPRVTDDQQGGDLMPDETVPAHTEASEALLRAHLAARAADGSKLRRALEDAAEALETGKLMEPAAKVRAALVDLDEGKLVELEALLEDARRSVSGTAGP